MPIVSASTTTLRPLVRVLSRENSSPYPIDVSAWVTSMRAGVEVDVVPPQAEDLAAAHASRRGEPEQHRMADLCRRVEERGELRRGPRSRVFMCRRHVSESFGGNSAATVLRYSRSTRSSLTMWGNGVAFLNAARPPSAMSAKRPTESTFNVEAVAASVCSRTL
jgi:hypothetical protein